MCLTSRSSDDSMTATAEAPGGTLLFGLNWPWQMIGNLREAPDRQA
jgi:hypothetical protein